VGTISITQPGAGARISPRSIGVKLIVVCGLAISMTIPGLFVGGLIDERTNRSAEVVLQISGSSGGQQTFLGPSLVVPYRVQRSASSSALDVYAVFPADASATLRTVTEERR
jgi:inner membrane protein